MAANQTDRPEGFTYLADFLSATEEFELVRRIEDLSFNEVRMHGVVAKRRVKHYGWLYGYESWKVTPAPPIPGWLVPLQERVASLMNVPAERVEEILISQYPAGAGIGWHRDAPMFGPTVVGVSLLSPCRFRFQRTVGERRLVAEQTLDPRSAYLLAGPSRSAWHHSIPPTKALRYSITFRTLKSTARSIHPDLELTLAPSS
jgi:alkylated DNA repair dioxygenase AlkB